jgi:uncharacterized integral membrane protein (TIGR00698 family)
MAIPSAAASPSRLEEIRKLAPGIALSLAVAIIAVAGAPLIATIAPIPAMVLALIIGVALNPIASRPMFAPGLTFCVKKLLRWAVALLGLRVALGEIIALGLPVALLVIISMAVTIVAGFMLARLLRQEPGYGALAGAGTAVCGASATLATSIVVPNYPGKEADTVFVVIAVNALSTVAMVLYPPLCTLLGFDATATGIMLGATIHDVAQVVGAGYAVSEPVGNSAVIVKLFRVFLLLPVVLAIGWWFIRSGAEAGEARVPVPVFALVFLALCLLNSAMPYAPSLMLLYAPIKDALVFASTWGLLIAIAALGLGTSLTAIRTLGWRHVATVSGTTVVILVVVTAGLFALQ